MKIELTEWNSFNKNFRQKREKPLNEYDDMWFRSICDDYDHLKRVVFSDGFGLYKGLVKENISVMPCFEI